MNNNIMIFGTLKYYIKICLIYLLYITGVLLALKVFLLRNKAVVLMYHRVLSESERRQSFSNEGIVVEVGSFDAQMQYLRKSFNVISLDEFVETCIGKKKFGKYSCLVTFDDGWVDNYTNAYPILKKYDLPAVIFLPVDFIGTGRKFWQEETSAILFALYEDSREKARLILENIGLKYITALPPNQAKKSIQQYITKLKIFSPDKRALIVSEISSYGQALCSSLKNIDVFLDWAQVKEMNKSKISFGSHSYNHKILTELDLEGIVGELNSSCLDITNQLGTFPRAFCYPNGDYTQQIVTLVSQAGYDAAFSTKSGHVTVNDSIFTVKRMNIHEHMTKNRPMFLARVLGLF